MTEARWLLIDVGNTHTVAALGAKQVRFRTDSAATADEYRATFAQLLGNTGEIERDIGRIIVSSVVPPLERSIREAFFGVPTLFVKSNTQREFELDLPFPEQLGADRLANVAGALTLGLDPKTPLLIVDAGTATTFCLVNSRRAYIGGAITPGLEISWKALQARAAKLFSVELTRPASSVGNTTETQLQSGVLLGYEALIEGLCERLIRDASRIRPEFERAQWIATGGVVNLLQLNPRFRIEPDLTLLGLKRYGQLTA